MGSDIIFENIKSKDQARQAIKDMPFIHRILSMAEMVQRPAYLQTSRERCRVTGRRLPVCGIGAGGPADENGNRDIRVA